jgi:hypothetical protein
MTQNLYERVGRNAIRCALAGIGLAGTAAVYIGINDYRTTPEHFSTLKGTVHHLANYGEIILMGGVFGGGLATLITPIDIQIENLRNKRKKERNNTIEELVE